MVSPCAAILAGFFKRRPVVAVVCGLSGSSWVAEDPVQEAFLRERDMGGIADLGKSAKTLAREEF